MREYGRGGRERRKQERPHYYWKYRLCHTWLVIATGLVFVGGFMIGRHESMLLLLSTVMVRFFDDKGEERPKEPLEKLGELSRHEEEIENKLMEEYGNFFGLVFDKAMINKLFVRSDISQKRLVRRIMIKILESQLNPRSDVTFTWATGGDSAAAGRGNLHVQSYTAVMEDTVKDAFALAGIRFIAKNYAMTWLPPAPEIALCMESIYGSDVDVLAYDFFSRKEGADLADLNLWINRAGIHPTKPILFMMDAKSNKKFNLFTGMEKSGMGTVLMDDDVLNMMDQRLDDVLNNTKREVPAALNHFICNGKREGNMPCSDILRNYMCDDTENGRMCLDNKYDVKGLCKNVKYQSSWNPGWKTHLRKGRLLGYFLVDMLTEAFVQLDSMSPATGDTEKKENIWASILQKLQKEESDDKASFLSSTDVGESMSQRFVSLHPSTLYRRNAICHTALLPSQTRYDGILTERKPKGDDKGYYDHGVSDMFVKPNGILPLVYNNDNYRRCDAMEKDFKDYFFVRAKDGWLETTVPNKSEIAAYGKNLKLEGYIMVCLRRCPLGRCPDDAAGLDSIKRNDGIVSVKVNGKAVTGVIKLDNCYLLEGESGPRWETGTSGTNCQYNLEFLVEQFSDKWLKISSIIVL